MTLDQSKQYIQKETQIDLDTLPQFMQDYLAFRVAGCSTAEATKLVGQIPDTIDLMRDKFPQIDYIEGAIRAGLAKGFADELTQNLSGKNKFLQAKLDNDVLSKALTEGLDNLGPNEAQYLKRLRTQEVVGGILTPQDVQSFDEIVLKMRRNNTNGKNQETKEYIEVEYQESPDK